MSKKDIKEIDRIVREEGLSKEQRRLLHEEITGQQLTREEFYFLSRLIPESIFRTLRTTIGWNVIISAQR